MCFAPHETIIRKRNQLSRLDYDMRCTYSRIMTVGATSSGKAFMSGPLVGRPLVALTVMFALLFSLIGGSAHALGRCTHNVGGNASPPYATQTAGGHQHGASHDHAKHDHAGAGHGDHDKTGKATASQSKIPGQADCDECQDNGCGFSCHSVLALVVAPSVALKTAILPVSLRRDLPLVPTVPMAAERPPMDSSRA